MGDRRAERDALLLSAGELAGARSGPVEELDPLEERTGSPCTIGCGNAPQPQRQRDELFGGQVARQGSPVVLVGVSDHARPVSRDELCRGCADVDSVDDRPAGRGPLESRDDTHEGRLASAARAEHDAELAALGLAVSGLVLAIRADLRDDRGELSDLEAQGATPALLRRGVTARAALVAAIGVLGGVVGGALLALLVTRVVSVTARATAPEPPLVTTVDPLVLAAAAVAFAASAATLVLLTTRRAFSEPRGPGRIGGTG